MSVPPSEKTLQLSPFKDFRYWPEIGWDNAQCHEADLHWQWLCSANLLHGPWSWNLDIFRDKLEPGLRDAVIDVNSSKDFKIQIWTGNVVIWTDHEANDIEMWLCWDNFCVLWCQLGNHYTHSDVMSVMTSQITSLMIVYSTVYSGLDQRKHQSSASLAFMSGIHGWPVNSPHKGPVTQKMFPFDEVIMGAVVLWASLYRIQI